MNYKIGELVWVKANGCPLWPCTISKGRTKMDDDNYYFSVRFMAQTSTALVAQSDVLPFDISRPQFKPSQEVLKKFKTLKKALALAQKKVNSLSKNSRPKESKNQIQVQKEQQAIPRELQIKFGKNNCDEQDSEKSISRISHGALRPKSPDSELQFFQENITEKHSQNKWTVSPINMLQDLSKEEHINISKELDLSPKKSSIGSKLAKNPLPSFKYAVSQNHLKKSFTDKVVDKQEYKVQSLSKIMTRYLVTPPNEQQQYLQEIKFKLQCIVFNLIDTSQNYDLLKLKFKQLMTKFQIQKINYKLVINSKINSLLTFIYKKFIQIKDFVEETQWLKTKILQLNDKLLKSINDCSLYQKVQHQKSQLFKKSSKSFLKSSINSCSKSQAILSQILMKCISEIDSKQKQYLTKLIFKSISDHNTHSAQIWKFIEQNVKKKFNSSSKFQEQFEAFIDTLAK